MKTKDGYVIMQDTFCEGLVLGEVGVPVLYDSLEEAQQELARRMIDSLQSFIYGDRPWECIIADINELSIEPVTLHEDGVLAFEGFTIKPGERNYFSYLQDMNGNVLTKETKCKRDITK